MDNSSLHTLADAIGQDLKHFLSTAAKSLKADQAEQDGRVADVVRSSADKLEQLQSVRDSQVISEIATKMNGLRKEVRMLTDERTAAFDKAITAAKSDLLATFREELRHARAEVVEEIATANRATHDTLVAMLQGRQVP